MSCRAERCERFTIRTISAAVWNRREIISLRFDDYRNISLHRHAISRGVLFIISRSSVLSARRIQYPSPWGILSIVSTCGTFVWYSELELHDFYRSLINALILNIIHEELQYPSEILSIVSCHLVSKIYHLIHHLSYVFLLFHFHFHCLIMPVK